jgi:hypothetical protein
MNGKRVWWYDDDGNRICTEERESERDLKSNNS